MCFGVGGHGIERHCDCFVAVGHGGPARFLHSGAAAARVDPLVRCVMNEARTIQLVAEANFKTADSSEVMNNFIKDLRYALRSLLKQPPLLRTRY